MLGVTGWAQGLCSSASLFCVLSLSLSSKGHQEKSPISESGPDILVLFPSEFSSVCESSSISNSAQLLTLWQWLGGGRGALWQPSERWGCVGEDQVEGGRPGWWKLLQFCSWTQSQREEASGAALWEMTVLTSFLVVGPAVQTLPFPPLCWPQLIHRSTKMGLEAAGPVVFQNS